MTGIEEACGQRGLGSPWSGSNILLAYTVGLMIVLGIVLLLLGVVLSINILYVLGFVLVVIGAALVGDGSMQRGVGGRRHWERRRLGPPCLTPAVGKQYPNGHPSSRSISICVSLSTPSAIALSPSAETIDTTDATIAVSCSCGRGWRPSSGRS